MTEARSQVHKFESSKVPGSEPSNQDSFPSLEEAHPLVASPLWPRIRAFLWQFASLCDESRIRSKVLKFEGSQVPDSEPANLQTCELSNALATTPRVAASALRDLGIAPFFHSFPSADASRLLLLSREDYARLAQFLGTIAFAPALRRVTAGAEVRALKAALPGVYPEALAFAAYFHKHESLFKKAASEESSKVRKFESSKVPAPEPANLRTCEPANILAAGHSLLAAALSDLPPELLLRQRLRFPAGSPADSALASLAGSQVHKFESSKVPDSEPSNLRTFEPSNGEAAAALAAARLALKLSNPTEYSTLCS